MPSPRNFIYAGGGGPRGGPTAGHWVPCRVLGPRGPVHEPAQVFVFHFDFQKLGTFTHVITLHFHGYRAISEKDTPGLWSKITAPDGGDGEDGRGWICHSPVLPRYPPVTPRVPPPPCAWVSGSVSAVGGGPV